MNEYNPLISVIIPVYKVEKFLKRCVESVLNQSYTNFEIILVDDGSPDNCGKICDDYAKKDARISVIHKKNGGLSSARNAGLDVAKGEWIFFIDSDDCIKEETFEELIKYSEKGKYDVVVGQMAHLYAGNHIKKCKLYEYSNDIEKIRKDAIIDKVPNYICSKLIKSFIFENLRFPLNQKSEDLYICPYVFMKAKSAIVIPKAYYLYSRENENSISNGKSLKGTISFKLGRFLSWKNHAEIAEKYYPNAVSHCKKEAIKNGIKAYIYNFCSTPPALSSNEKECIKEYLKENKDFKLSFSKNIQRFFIINKCNFATSLLSSASISAFRLHTYFRMKRWEKSKK